MKKILLILTCIPLLFHSCKKDKENSTNNNISINIQNMTGTWIVNSLIFDDSPNLVTDPNLQTAAFIMKPDMRFTQNVLYDGDLDIDAGDWNLSGSVLTLLFDTEEEIQYNINSLNNTTAKLTLVYYLNDDGDDVYETGSATLEKQ